MSNYFLGVDGGQSSTTAVIGDDQGHIAGWASAGPCNHVGASEGRAKFLRVMGDCLSQAASRAGLDPRQPRFRAACLGMSGGPEDKTALLHELLEADHIMVTNDGRIALAGAMAGDPGVIVIAGTGSFAYGENAHGETARAGGWGYVFGDEGGGFDIIRQALRAMLREQEGWGPRTALTPALLEAAESSDANEAVHRFYTVEWPRSRVASLAPIVNRIAEAGDPIAVEILHSAAQSLALLAASVRRQLWKDDEASKLAWIGGAFNSDILRERFRMLAELDGTVSAGSPQHSPALGALVLAYRLGGLYLMPEPFGGLKG
ncbi:MAG TPA: BadF/BadG/BcrA/BcrD ATPase family protein [Bryobacteraceae bacterium]|nr:BadF/BadG/BcrA/BcrD ATPase family protein [Bryobacteraceae bacterium]